MSYIEDELKEEMEMRRAPSRIPLHPVVRLYQLITPKKEYCGELEIPNGGFWMPVGVKDATGKKIFQLREVNLWDDNAPLREIWVREILITECFHLINRRDYSA